MEQYVIQITGGITINVNVSVKNCHICEKDYVWNPARCNCENVKYIGSIMGDSVIIRDEITYSEEKSFNLKNKTCKTQHFYILLAF